MNAYSVESCGTEKVFSSRKDSLGDGIRFFENKVVFDGGYDEGVREEARCRQAKEYKKCNRAIISVKLY